MSDGVLVTFCIRCMCQWHTDMEEFAPGDWRSVDPADRDVTTCPDCGGELTMPDRIVRPEQPSPEADQPRDRLGGSPPSEPDDR